MAAEEPDEAFVFKLRRLERETPGPAAVLHMAVKMAAEERRSSADKRFVFKLRWVVA
jgi:hypothetical protein